MALEWKTVYAEMQSRQEAEYPPAALHYLLQICRQLSMQIENRIVNPGQLVREFRSRVQRDFGSLSNRVLADWGLLSSEDLGKAVVLLAGYNCLILEPTDTVEAFAALESQP